MKVLKHEAEFFGLLPLGKKETPSMTFITKLCVVVKRLAVCDELERSNCGSLLFYCQINPPVFESLPANFEPAATPTEGNGNGNGSLRLPPPPPHAFPHQHYSRRVVQLLGQGNCIAVAYRHCICVLG